MKLREVVELTEASVVCGNVDEIEVEVAFCSDLMSDVLTCDADDGVLITGLATVQTIRTAEMADAACILLVRNKAATESMVRLAEERGIAIIQSKMAMFKVAGILYQGGLKPVF